MAITVKELMDKLKEFPEDTPVVLGCRPDGNYCTFIADTDIDEIDCDKMSIKTHQYVGSGNYKTTEETRDTVIIWGDEM